MVKQISLEKEREVADLFYEKARDVWLSEKTTDNLQILASAMDRLNKIDKEIIEKLRIKTEKELLKK